MLRNRRIFSALLLYPKSIITTWWAREFVRQEKRHRHILRYPETMVINDGTLCIFCYCNVCVYVKMTTWLPREISSLFRDFWRCA